MTVENICPHCGKPVPPTALGGICPECMLKAGLAGDTGEIGPGGTVVAKPPQPVPRIEDLAPHFPQLEILECLGRGGMGAVYKARQPKLDRFVALKILTRRREGGITDTEFAARFQQEARALARITHPDIVAVYDFGEVDGYHYLLMEYVDGLTLRQLLQTGKLSPEQALSIVPKICEALQFAHERGIVHRDIKPENILLDKQGQVKIADFGIAKIVAPELSGQGLTGAKDVIGTPHYMAPEQVEKPTTVDHRADIYSLGVVFYEMLTGELPLGKFQAPSKRVQVDVRLDEVVLHALEKEPDRRYQHASEVKTDVETIAASPAASTEPTKRATRSSVDAAIERHGTCYFSTPERMRKCFPSAAAQIFICKGELRLGLEALTFLTVWQTRVVIPLKDIEDLSIGQFQMWTTPWVMQYERVNFLSVTFSNEGRRQTVHLTPVPAETTSAHQINEQIGGWFEAIQEAVIARTGAAPRVSEPHTVSISAEPAWNRKGVPLTIAFLVALGLVMWRFRSIFSSAPEPLAVVVFVIMCVIMWLLLTALLWFAFGFLRANYAIKRGDLHVVTSNEPPENRWLGFSGPGMTPEQSHSVAAAEVQLPYRSWGTRLGFALVILSGLTLLGLALQSWLPSKLRPTLIVTGTVSDAATGLPISGARVADNRYGSEAGRAAQESWSDPNGHFTLKTWPEEHTLVASAPGYERKLATLTSSLWGRERTARMDFHLLPVKSRAVADEFAAAVPPVVVSTVPESGVSNVDPALTQIQVTFSKDMMTNRMSAISCRVSGDTFPEHSGEFHYLDDRRTCVVPVRLAAGKTYALWFNLHQFDSFRDTQNHPAVPYLLIFKTRK